MEKSKIEKYRDYLINWIKDWFEMNGLESQAVIGISGGKDSTTVSALCVAALGKERVIGVLMPNGVQNDIDDSYAVCNHLGIDYVVVNINDAYASILGRIGDNRIEISEQTRINLAPRLRMSTLYAVAQSVNGRVVGTSNRSEWMTGYFTKWGDGVSDCEPIIKLTAGEVVELGLALGLPEHLVKKTPSDGLCGMSDEEKMGFTYAELDDWLYNGETDDKLKEKYEKMRTLVDKSAFKRKPIPEPEKSLSDMV